MLEDMFEAASEEDMFEVGLSEDMFEAASEEDKFEVGLLEEDMFEAGLLDIEPRMTYSHSLPSQAGRLLADLKEDFLAAEMTVVEPVEED